MGRHANTSTRPGPRVHENSRPAKAELHSHGHEARKAAATASTATAPTPSTHPTHQHHSQRAKHRADAARPPRARASRSLPNSLEASLQGPCDHEVEVGLHHCAHHAGFCAKLGELVLEATLQRVPVPLNIAGLVVEAALRRANV